MTRASDDLQSRSVESSHTEVRMGLMRASYRSGRWVAEQKCAVKCAAPHGEMGDDSLGLYEAAILEHSKHPAILQGFGLFGCNERPGCICVSGRPSTPSRIDWAFLFFVRRRGRCAVDDGTVGQHSRPLHVSSAGTGRAPRGGEHNPSCDPPGRQRAAIPPREGDDALRCEADKHLRLIQQYPRPNCKAWYAIKLIG